MISMLTNYLKIGFRTLLRNKAFSAINIFGLALSMSVCLLVILIIAEQYQTDRWNPLKDQVYRVNTYTKGIFGGNLFATSALPLAEEFNNVSAVDKTLTIKSRFSGDADTGFKKVPVQGIYASKEFFSVLGFDLALGNPSTALVEPYSIILTEQAAEKLFDRSESIVGRTLSFENLGEYTVTGVIPGDRPKSHVDGFEIIISMSTLPELEAQNKLSATTTDYSRYYDSYVYCLLKDGEDISVLDPILENIKETHYSSDENLEVSLRMQTLTSINPRMEERSNELSFAMPVFVIFFIGGLAFLVILTATFNYTNLSIAKSLSRMKEVGVRKVSGATRRQVFGQFISESILTSLIALVLAFGMLEVIKPFFFKIDPHLQEIFVLKTNLTTWWLFLGFAIFVGILAGVLPALLLARLRPYEILKKATSVKLMSNWSLRKILIVLQFSLSLIFITSAFILHRQFEYAMNFDLGFDRENILNVQLQGNEYQTVATELGRVTGVTDVAGMGYAIGVGQLWGDFVKNPDEPDSVNFYYNPITSNYITNMKHEFVAGRNFFEVMNDSTETHIILNEKAVKELRFGSPEEAIGRIVDIEDDKSVQVIGVVKDFQNTRITEPLRPFAFRYQPKDIRVANIKLESDNIQQTMAALESTWNKLDEVHEFEYEFYDDQIAEAYSMYRILNLVIGFFAFLAITISILGLLGMVIYSTQSRLKEVGIRKVLGAETPNLVWLLSKGFVVLLLIAVILAIPVSFLLNNAWLEQLTNRTPITFMDMAMGVVLLLGLGLIITISQTYLTSLQNPSETLRDE